MLRDGISQMSRMSYRQGFDDCMSRFNIKPVVADLKYMREEQERQVITIIHFAKKDLFDND